MAVNDPTAGVPTPTGVLQGAASFSWDGSTWQPSARASVGVGTPTGVLRGVAPFSWSGSAWTPAGAGPEVAATGGVLDGVAVYTWSGSAWTPAGGGPDVPTPTGTLQGVAAFYWDGTAWQPSGQAGPDVATSAGVLQGMAMFSQAGSGWAPTVSPAGLDMNFLTMSVLDPSVTFTRASTATYFDANGVMQTAATNAPRLDHNPATRASLGLLMEEARTNQMLWSGDVSHIPPWNDGGGGGVAGPSLVGFQILAPDGVTQVQQLSYPAISGAGAFSQMNQPVVVTANAFTFSAWMRGAVGGEQNYLMATPDGVTYYRQLVTLTTAWQRFSLTTPALTAATWYFQIGVDLRDASQTSKPARNMYLWGTQVEQGAFVTSYIPTSGASVTRSADAATLASIPGRNTAAESFEADFMMIGSNGRIIGGAGQVYGMLMVGTLFGETYDGIAVLNTANILTVGTVAKLASTWTSPNAAKVCLNAGAVASATTLTNGFAGTTGIQFMGDGTPADIATGWIRRFRYWPRALSNTEMQQVTT